MDFIHEVHFYLSSKKIIKKQSIQKKKWDCDQIKIAFRFVELVCLFNHHNQGAKNEKNNFINSNRINIVIFVVCLSGGHF